MGNPDSPDNKMMLPALVLSRFTTQIPSILTGMLLIDIGLTFNTSVGVTGQIRTVSSMITLLFSVMMVILSTRYQPKTLLLIGLLTYGISALGCYTAQDFTSMLSFYALSGVGFALVSPMTSTLVGAHIQPEKRSTAIGYLIASLALSYLIGAPAIGYLAGIGGWRLAFLGYILPISLLSLTIAFFGLPSVSMSPQSRGYTHIFEGFKAVISNSSAVGCLVGMTLSLATWSMYLSYAASLLRQRFETPMSMVSALIIVSSFSYITGSLFGGRFANRFGRKQLSVYAALLMGLFLIGYFNLFSMFLAIVVGFFGSFFGGLRASAGESLTLEQIPAFRGSLMSLNSAASSFGSVLGAGLGGTLLVAYNYNITGIVLGGFSLVAAVIYYALTVDPTKITDD